jgi:hypothetical protein
MSGLEVERKSLGKATRAVVDPILDSASPRTALDSSAGLDNHEW